MRQINDGEKNGADKHCCSEYTQVAQSHCPQRKQSEKGSHRGDIAYHERGYDLFEVGAGVLCVASVYHHMERVVDSNTNDDSANADDYQRYAMTHHGDDGNTEEHTECHGEEYIEDVLGMTECEQQQEYDKQQG